jgi:hypothetical protein
VLSKASREIAVEALTRYPGAHMMTAGLLDQDASPDQDRRMSIFTKFLAEGLEGQADSNQDDVVTLNELLVYVQNNVSEYVKARYDKEQTPMMGKVKGAGEMLFILK